MHLRGQHQVGRGRRGRPHAAGRGRTLATAARRKRASEQAASILRNSRAHPDTRLAADLADFVKKQHSNSSSSSAAPGSWSPELPRGDRQVRRRAAPALAPSVLVRDLDSLRDDRQSGRRKPTIVEVAQGPKGTIKVCRAHMATMARFDQPRRSST